MVNCSAGQFFGVLNIDYCVLQKVHVHVITELHF